MIGSTARSSMTSRSQYRKMSAGNPQYSEMELIQTSLIGSAGTGNFNFVNIPQVYKHLQVRITMRLDGATVTNLPAFDFHPISGGTTYAQHYLQGNGSTVTSAANANLGIINFSDTPAGNATANVYSSVIMDILDYTSTTKNKTVRILSGFAQDASNSRIELRSGLWINTGALNDIRFRPYGAANFVAGSRFSLYGVK